MRLRLDLVAGAAPETAESLAGAAVLTPYGVDIRYPGDFPEVIPGQEIVLYELAGRVRAAVKAMLKTARS